MTKNRPRSGSSASSRRDSSCAVEHVLEHVGADHGARLGRLQPGEVGIVEHVADQVDALGSLEIGMDDAHSARFQGAENQFVDVGLLDLAEVLGGGTEIEERRQLLRARARQRAAEPFGIAAHHAGLRRIAAGTAAVLQGSLSDARPLTLSRPSGNPCCARIDLAHAFVDFADGLDDSAPRSGRGPRRALAPGVASVM